MASKRTKNPKRGQASQQPSQHSNNGNQSDNQSDIDNDDDKVLTTKDLERILPEKFNQQTAVLTSKIESLSSELAEAKDIVASALQLAEQN